MILFTASGALATAYAKQFPCEIISARQLNDEQLSNYLKKATVVIHNAAAIQADNLSAYMNANFELTKRVLNLVYSVNPLIRFINISSMSILKDADTYLTQKEMTDYAVSKYLAEMFCTKHPLSIKHKNTTNVRFSTLFYENKTRDGLSKLGADAVDNQKITLINNGISERDFIPIDIAAAYLFKLTTTTELPLTINIASGKPLSFKYFSGLILKEAPSVKIENLELPMQTVLSDFKIDKLKDLGEIEFDMGLIFKNYYKQLFKSF